MLPRTRSRKHQQRGNAPVGQTLGLGRARRSKRQAAEQFGSERAERMAAGADMRAIEFSGDAGNPPLDIIERIDHERNIARAIAPRRGIGDVFAQGRKSLQQPANFAIGFALRDGIIVRRLDHHVAARRPILP